MEYFMPPSAFVRTVLVSTISWTCPTIEMATPCEEAALSWSVFKTSETVTGSASARQAS